MPTYLIKIGELSLKGGNKHLFVKSLKWNIKNRLKGGSRFYGGFGRYYLETDLPKAMVEEVLSCTFGIVGFVEVVRTEKEMSAIQQEALIISDQVQRERGRSSFKVEARRQDKSFPLRSYDIACALGKSISEAFPLLEVKVNKPDWILSVEIREKALIYGPQKPGLGGLPAGTAGKGLLLLSGGIDSPVAGYLMAKRGLGIEAVYFHTPPFTSQEARKKVEDLCRILGRYIPGITLLVVPFTEPQLLIKERARESETTLLMRAGMMTLAGELVKERGLGALITGEALSQVASQTVESLRFTNSYAEYPVFRPCIGLDKEEIIEIARRIGTFETSILPYDDCCTLFAPQRPMIRPEFKKMRESFQALNLMESLDKAKENLEVVSFEGEL